MKSIRIKCLTQILMSHAEKEKERTIHYLIKKYAEYLYELQTFYIFKLCTRKNRNKITQLKSQVIIIWILIKNIPCLLKLEDKKLSEEDASKKSSAWEREKEREIAITRLGVVIKNVSISKTCHYWEINFFFCVFFNDIFCNSL